jgi:FkbH-like protein
MATIKAEFDDLLTTANLAQLRAGLAAWRAPLSLPQVQRLTAHARALGTDTDALRIGIIHTYTSDLLDPWLGMAGALHGLDVLAYHAPYGMALQEAAEGSGLLAHQPDITLLMLRREDLHPGLARPVVDLDGAAQTRLRAEALAQLRTIIELFRAQRVGHLVLTLLPTLSEPALGHYDAQSERPEAAWWAAFKSDVGRWMRESVASSLFLDLDEVLLQVGRNAFFDRRYWYTAQFPFASQASRDIARRIVGIGVVLKTPRAKVLVLDADNTLWGGIVGEDGIDGIALGPDYPGVAYLEFQRRILDFQQRGLILALCSKNNPADVDQVLRDHPHQILRDSHFAARRVNWLPKAENLASLAKELNLGLDSFVFVDDSDHECAAIRHALPQVEVIQTPARPVDVPTCLDQVARLELLTLTSEDVAKTDLYAQERRRRELSENIGQAGGVVGDYLTRLGMKMRLHLNAESHLARLSQLTQKTNQFNLTTRRYDEQQMKAFIGADDWLVADFSLADTFGDSGVVGLALLRLCAPHRAELDTFLMSCRVIGREAEAAFLHALLRRLAAQGVVEVVADFVPTAKNAMAKSFLADQGFEPGADGRQRRDLRANPPMLEAQFPIAVSIDAGGDAGAVNAQNLQEINNATSP